MAKEQNRQPSGDSFLVNIPYDEGDRDYPSKDYLLLANLLIERGVPIKISKKSTIRWSKRISGTGPRKRLGEDYFLTISARDETAQEIWIAIVNTPEFASLWSPLWPSEDPNFKPLKPDERRSRLEQVVDRVLDQSPKSS